MPAKTVVHGVVVFVENSSSYPGLRFFWLEGDDKPAFYYYSPAHFQVFAGDVIEVTAVPFYTTIADMYAVIGISLSEEEEPPKFKVGDRVRVVADMLADDKGTNSIYLGREGTIIPNKGDEFFKVQFDPITAEFSDTELALA